MAIINRIAAFVEDMRAWRHDIHQHPELAYEEHRTGGRVAELLREFGVDEVAEGIGKTGVGGVIRNGEGPAIGLRADMDALPIVELTGVPHQSVNDGVMHACGHDGHTSMLLGAAKYLTETRNFSGTVVLVFQPAEEGLAGAKAMIDDGLFERFPVDAIYGVHNMPGLAEGEIRVSAGPVMAAADSFTVTVKGRGGHGAMPHMSIDPVVVAAAMVGGLQSLVSRNLDPHKTLVVSVTQIHGGDTFNVIPDTVTLGGTVRYFEKEVGDANRQRMEALLNGIAAAHGASMEMDYKIGYPPTLNHAAEAAFAAGVASEITGSAAGDQLKVMGSEDFSFFLLEKPGAYAWVGNGNEPDRPMLHNPHYDFNDNIMPTGASYFARLVETSLPRI